MIAQILSYYLPGAQWSLKNESYSGIDWLDKEIEKPSEDQLNTWMNGFPEILAVKEIQRQRAFAYSTESDPLFFKWQRGESTQQEYFNKVQEIRDRYPYPGEEV